MGHEVKFALAGVLLGLGGAQAVHAQPADAGQTERAEAPSGAVGMDLFLSADADKTDVYKAGLNLDVRYRNPNEFLGLRLEKAWIKPLGLKSKSFDRAYLRYADKRGHWAWNGQLGTDGDTVLGSFSINDDARFRKEFFVERDIVETPQGVANGIYYTFAGAALDLPVDDRNSFTLVAGAQAFTGDNVRLHARANFVHVVKPEWGLSAQLRGRYFHSSDPGEYDYFSPRWYVEIIPILQMRRYSGGWRYSLAGGVGAQRDSGSKWRNSKYLNAQVTSPPVGRKWYLKAAALYSNTPVGSGYVYSYGQLTIGLTRTF